VHPSHPPGTPCWVDLGTPLPDRAADFYGALFGWSVDAPDGDGYRLCRLDGRLVAALGPSVDPGAPYWTTSIAVDDVDASAARILAAGGSVVAGPADAGASGRFAVAVDTVGAPVSLWQPRAHAGAEVRHVPGAWTATHLVTDDASAPAFYADVFGWDAVEGDGITSFGLATGSTAPVTVATAGPPDPGWSPVRRSLWLVVFAVADVDATRRAAEAAGGRSVARHDGGRADTHLVEDDQGAVFGLRHASR